MPSHGGIHSTREAIASCGKVRTGNQRVYEHKCFFNRHIIKVWVRCYLRYPGTAASSAAEQTVKTVSLFFVVLEATYESRSLESELSAKKAPHWTDTRELFGGPEEKSFSARGVIDLHSFVVLSFLVTRY